MESNPKGNGKSADRLAVTPITVTHPETVDIGDIRLFREPAAPTPR